MISKVFMFKLQPIMCVLPAINICYNFSQAWDFLALQTPTTRIHTSSQPNNKNPGQGARSSEAPNLL